MPRELPTFRDNLERLNVAFDHEALTRSEIEAFTGMTDKTVKKYFPFQGKYISKVNFAQALARLGSPEARP